jgi:hypothetical protein
MSRRIKRTFPPGERLDGARPHRRSNERVQTHRPGGKPEAVDAGAGSGFSNGLLFT